MNMLASVGTSVLTPEIKTAITEGLANLQATAIDVIAVVVVTSVTIIALNAGYKFALSKLRSTLSKAS